LGFFDRPLFSHVESAHVPPEERTLVFKPIRRPLWTENKARLIARYLYYFVLITKHGAYIDGFAAPQNDDLSDNWSAKLVLQSEPKFLRDFWLCDINRSGIKAIRKMVSEQPVVSTFFREISRALLCPYVAGRASRCRGTHFGDPDAPRSKRLSVSKRLARGWA
jgi:hypothetical protein